jgi:hypothetical protein
LRGYEARRLIQVTARLIAQAVNKNASSRSRAVTPVMHGGHFD